MNKNLMLIQKKQIKPLPKQLKKEQKQEKPIDLMLKKKQLKIYYTEVKKEVIANIQNKNPLLKVFLM